MTLIYDGSFEEFLCLVYAVYYKKLSVHAIIKEQPSTLLIDEYYTIEYDEEKSQKVLHALQTKFPKRAFHTILHIFMCDTRVFEMELLHYIILGFKDPKELGNINNEYVRFVGELERELFRMKHKMLGFLRFEELEDGTLYAKLDVHFNILYFLAKHFLKRLNNQKFIIHDLQRELAYIHTPEYSGMQKVAAFETPKHSENEAKFRKLWQTFFIHVSIESRSNPKVQQNFVPLLYRTYMSEFQ
jgi:probable DNA metabolism protein